MKPLTVMRSLFSATVALAALLVAGCASSGSGSSGTATPTSPNRFTTTDGRSIDIGRSTPAEGGRRYNNPHMEKGKCWVADGFTFTGYDTIYIAPTLSTASFPDEQEDTMVHDLARERLASELVRKLKEHGISPSVVTEESAIQPNTKVLRLENTITEFKRGGGAARYFVGLYGGGQPVLRVQGKATDADRTLFTFEARRSGTSAGARVAGVFMKDEDIQIQDIRSMALDLTDFMAALAGKYQPAN